MLAEHFQVKWIDKRYNWNLTDADISESQWKFAARYLDMEDTFERSKEQISLLDSEIEILRFTRKKIGDQENILKASISEIEGEARRRIDDFATAVMDRKALESPAQSWQEKESTHSRNARGWFWASGIWIVLVMVGGFLGASWIAERSVTTNGTGVVAAASLAPQIDKPKEPASGASTQPPPTDVPAAPEAQTVNAPGTQESPADKPATPAAQTVKAPDKPALPLAARERLDTPLAIVFITTYVLLAISIFRFMTRQYQMEQRLADDARQRRTMMNSYLALLEHKSNPITDAERPMVLQVLFRGTSLTEPNDDISPANLIDALVAAAMKKDKG